MSMRLRQVALVARDLEPVVGDLCAVLGVEIGFRDPGVATFGLTNALLPIGDTFLEVVSPAAPGTTAGRWLDRRGGDCGYMVMVQTADADADRARMARLGVRVVWSADLLDIRGTHLHPRDVGGAILSLDTPVPAASWRWAGPEWTRHVRTDVVHEIVAVEMTHGDPGALARRWGEVLDRPVRATDGATWELALDRGVIRFRAGADAGVTAVSVSVVDPHAVLRRARDRGVATGPAGVRLCGVDVVLVRG
jgi:hypothetical protein